MTGSFTPPMTENLCEVGRQLPILVNSVVPECALTCAQDPMDLTSIPSTVLKRHVY
jgi:hypothetical protein